MFDLEQAIADWRKQMLAAGIKTPAPLEELENHLREEVGAHVSSGVSEAEAFRLAVARVGRPQSVAAEFKKSQPISTLPALIGAAAWALGAIGLVVVLFPKWMGGQMSLLLLAHVVALTAGYGAAYLVGIFGIYYVCRRQIPGFLPLHQVVLRGAVLGFSQLAAGLVIAGMLLGTVWYKLHHGHFLAGVPREFGALGAIVWLVAFSLMQRGVRLRLHTTMLLGIVGSMLISLAWFGAGILEHGRGIMSYWPLNLLLGGQLFFILLGFLPAAETTGIGKEKNV